MSEKGIPDAPPKCERCGSDRTFEFQITPQLFDKLPELRLVDWNTIVIYTCSGNRTGKNGCYPKFEKEEFYVREHAYIQLSDDFTRVQLGDEAQIQKQKAAKKEEVPKEEPKKEEGSEKKKKKKNKKKKKSVEETTLAPREEQKQLLDDLMANFSLK